MPYPPEFRKPSTEAEVLDGARCYANACRRAEVLHRKRTLAVEAERLDAECDQADRELEEALAVLLTAASGLVEDADGSEEHGSDDKGFNVLAGGGVAQKVESNDSEDADVTEVAPAA